MSAFPFRVEFGYSLAEGVNFATFELALAFYRGFVMAVDSVAEQPKRHQPRLVNIDNLDGSEDARNGGTGLTDEEREAVEEIS